MQKNYLSDNERHEALKLYICQKIQEAKGAIPFSEYMHHALYASELGYYAAHPHIFGTKAEQDFVTAPEISILFGQTLAHVCHEILKKMPEAVIVEFGAGTGKLAEDILNTLETLGTLPREYWIVDPSLTLQEKQKARLKKYLDKGDISIQWFSVLPEQPFSGFVIANEVLDAFPAQRFQVTDSQCFEAFVIEKDGEFQEEYRVTQDPAIEFLAKNIRAESSPELLKHRPYQSERLPELSSFFETLSKIMQHGAVLLLDYGFPRHEFYHPDRYMGTLMCHQQQRSHADPFKDVGLQDITTHVDFTDVAEKAFDAGFRVAGYTQQAAFLMNAGLLSLCADTTSQFKIKTALHLLTSPSEMGELFKVMALTKNWDLFPFPGFEHFDKRHSL